MLYIHGRMDGTLQPINNELLVLGMLKNYLLIKLVSALP